MRWKTYFDELSNRLNGAEAQKIDFYKLEELWTRETKTYADQPEGDVIQVAKEVYNKIAE